MKMKNYSPNTSGKYGKANSIEICQTIESCRQAIMSCKISYSYRLTIEHVINSLDDAIYDFASIIAEDDPVIIKSILNEIGYIGNQILAEE